MKLVSGGFEEASMWYIAEQTNLLFAKWQVKANKSKKKKNERCLTGFINNNIVLWYFRKNLFF